MASIKKGIFYKASYKALKNIVSDKLDKEHQFSTKKERKQAVRSILGETRSAFEDGIAAYLNTNIDRCVRDFSSASKEVPKVNVKETKKVKPIGALKSSAKKGSQDSP